MRTSVSGFLKSSAMKYAALLVGSRMQEKIKEEAINTVELEALRKAHFPRPQARPANISSQGYVMRAPVPIIGDERVPHLTREGKQVMHKVYVLSDPNNPDSAKRLVTRAAGVHIGTDRKALKKALYNQRRAEMKRWVN